METTIEQIALKLKVYEGTIMRVSEYLGIHVYDQTVGSIISSKAVLHEDFIHFLDANSDFYKRYHDDYHAQKNPDIIAKTINRNPETVMDYMKVHYKEFFDSEMFKPECEKELKYVSSYEIDFKMGSESSLNTNALGVVPWHLGFKQQMLIEHLKTNARLRRKGVKPVSVWWRAQQPDSVLV